MKTALEPSVATKALIHFQMLVTKESPSANVSVCSIVNLNVPPAAAKIVLQARYKYTIVHSFQFTSIGTFITLPPFVRSGLSLHRFPADLNGNFTWGQLVE
jgi:hypothetical protein